MHKWFKIVPKGSDFDIVEVEQQQLSWVVPKESVVATVKNTHLINAIYFAKQVEVDNVITSLISTLRIAKDVCENSQVSQQICDEIEKANKYRESLKDFCSQKKTVIDGSVL